MPWKTLRASEVCPDHLPLPQPVCEGGDQPVTPDQVKVLHIEKVKEVVTKDSKKEFENLESWSVLQKIVTTSSWRTCGGCTRGRWGWGRSLPDRWWSSPGYYSTRARIAGYETLQEYMNNNHPLWGPHRELLGQVLFKERTQGDLFRFIASNWRDQRVNTARKFSLKKQRSVT